jgi:hypothetical protein
MSNSIRKGEAPGLNLKFHFLIPIKCEIFTFNNVIVFVYHTFEFLIYFVKASILKFLSEFKFL